MNRSRFEEPTSLSGQEALWFKSHVARIQEEVAYPKLANAPSPESARLFAKHLQPGSTILEIGSGIGAHTARYFVDIRPRLGFGKRHTVYCADFAFPVLRDIEVIAEADGTQDRLIPIKHDIREGTLPDIGDVPLHGFYARSALPLDDDTMVSLTEQIHEKLEPGGIILLEGKTAEDYKIKRSLPMAKDFTLEDLRTRNIKAAKNLVADIDPSDFLHIRRIWSPKFMKELSERFSWEIIDLGLTTEEIKGKESHFVHLLARKQE